MNTIRQLNTEALQATGLSERDALEMLAHLRTLPEDGDAPAAWGRISTTMLAPDQPFALHRLLYDTVFADWDENSAPRPAWSPNSESEQGSNIASFCAEHGIDSYSDLHASSIARRDEFWQAVVERLGIVFQHKPAAVRDPDSSVEAPRWLPGARFNIAQSAFQAPGEQTAVICQAEGGEVRSVTYTQLDRLSNRVANALVAMGIEPGDRVAIAMAMTLEAVAAYLGIVKAGAVVVSIADSFAADEIATRLRIADASTVITQDVIPRAGKRLPMYRKVVDAGARTAIVVADGDAPAVELREHDVAWDDFISTGEAFDPLARNPDDTMNILFSSGTTGDPKAIPWTHTTPIKCGMDGFFHHDIKPRDVVAWPTNLGWMMGPWLIYAALLNRATVALYYGAPNTPEFCRFVQDAGVTMLGVVPSLVKAWRHADCTRGLDWSAIRAFSSTGESSNPEDMLYLMSRAGYRPVIEYCGGTEIGGGYLTGTVVQPSSPSTFSTIALGLNLYILDENAQPTDDGEVFLVPPSIGLSNTLLNRDHREVYYAGTPTTAAGEILRRHGDQIGILPGSYYRSLGRADDTMNLGGIKISSAELERVANSVPGIVETAAIAVDPPGGGPSRLVVYAVLEADVAFERSEWITTLQKAISSRLNPLFRVSDVVGIDTLPRTASNKVMRRVLRGQYTQASQ